VECSSQPSRSGTKSWWLASARAARSARNLFDPHQHRLPGRCPQFHERHARRISAWWPTATSFIALSYSGETDELISLVPALRRLDVTMIAMTGNPQSFLAGKRRSPPRCPGRPGGLPAQSRPHLQQHRHARPGRCPRHGRARGARLNKEDFARFHPGGKLGRTLLFKVRQIMRGPDRMAIVPPDTAVGKAIIEMAQRRAGSAIIISETGELAGVFHPRRFRPPTSRPTRP